MKSSTQQSPILDEQGIVITRTHLTVPGMRFKWGDLGTVRIVKKKNLMARLIGVRLSKFDLIVSTKADPAPVSIFQTQDIGFKERIEQAIDHVAKLLGGQREL